MPASPMNTAFHARRKAEKLLQHDPYYIQYSCRRRLCVCTILSQFIGKTQFLPVLYPKYPLWTQLVFCVVDTVCLSQATLAQRWPMGCYSPLIFICFCIYSIQTKQCATQSYLIIFSPGESSFLRRVGMESQASR